MITTSIVMALVIIVIAGVAYVAGNRFGRKSTEGLVAQAEELASRVLDDARREADNIAKEAELKAKDAAIEAKETAEGELKEKKREI